MSKYALLITLMLFLTIVTLIAGDIEYATSVDITTSTPDDSGTIASIFTMLGVLFRVLTFQIPALPPIVNIIVFYPLTIGVMYMIIDVVKDVIPFT